MNEYLNQPYSNLLKVAADNNEAYLQATPFPNIYFKNFFNPDILDKVLEEFGDLSRQDVIIFDGSLEKKLASKSGSHFKDNTKIF